MNHCNKCWDGGYDGGFCMSDNCECHEAILLNDFRERFAKATIDAYKGKLITDFENFFLEKVRKSAFCSKSIDVTAICGQRLVCPLHTVNYGESENHELWDELVDALVLMYEQYCQDGHQFMSAGEAASNILEKVSPIRFDEIGRITHNPSN